MIYKLYTYGDVDLLPSLTIYRLGFSGHRFARTKIEARCDPHYFYLLNRRFGGAIWVHGGSRFGFDAQVETYCNLNNIAQEPHLPDYEKYAGRPKYAPLARNWEIVDSSDAIVCLWDGRKSGGTWRTCQYALNKGLPVILLRLQ